MTPNFNLARAKKLGFEKVVHCLERVNTSDHAHSDPARQVHVWDQDRCVLWSRRFTPTDIVHIYKFYLVSIRVFRNAS
jgi:hypothetical protein